MGIVVDIHKNLQRQNHFCLRFLFKMKSISELHNSPTTAHFNAFLTSGSECSDSC